VSGIDQITYRARVGVAGIMVLQTETSIRDLQQTYRWQRQLEPWLRAGSPQGSAYLDFESQAAFVRWQASGGTRAWEHARVLVGRSAELSGTYALELGEFDGSRSALAALTAVGPPGPRREAIEQRARSAAAIGALIPLLAHALQGTRRLSVASSAPGLPEAVMWGLISILRMIGDSQPVSFITCSSAPVRDGDIAGLLVSFPAAGADPLPPDPGFAELAADLARRFADDPAELRRLLKENRVHKADEQGSRISRLLSLPPRSQSENAYQEGPTTVSTPPNPAPRPAATPGPAAAARPVAAPRPAAAGPAAAPVMCPVCLTEIPDWNALDYWSYSSDGDYEKISIPPDANPIQRARYLHGAYVRCPGSQGEATAIHHLPQRYGHFGAPVLLGFIGLTQSGKTHLLTSMIGGIGQLSDYGVEVEPLDPAMHHRFLESSVKPLIGRSEVLPGTPDDATTEIADAFIVRHGTGSERVVALFDVSGGVLARMDQPGKTREFLWIADGLFFVVDPDHIRASKVGDETFTNVLSFVRNRPQVEPASAAIVVGKADRTRFDEPMARWLRSGNGTLDPTEFLRESADVYSYLVDGHDAEALTEPYRVCEKATLHVASSTGGSKEGEERGGKYPRGVAPSRVLRPLVAMLAMTGVLTGPQAELIGV
jgi:hypothetical protein